MSLKETLAARTASKNQEKDQKKNLEADFKRNFQNLYKNFSGAWLSFGDERLAREALMDMANTLVGRELIASMPEGLEMESTNFLSDVEGAYTPQKNEISFNTDIFSSDPSEKMRYIATISHELRHAVQKKKGLWGENKGLSIEQHVIAQKLIEAETEAWDRVLMASTSLDGKEYGDRGNWNEFLKRDLVAEAKENAGKRGEKFDEKRFRAEDTSYLLQTALKEEIAKCKTEQDSRPVIYAAQKKVVGYEMKRLMNLPENAEGKDAIWRTFYDTQALGNALAYVDDDVTGHGNVKEFNKILDYYHQEYGLKHSDIDQMNLHPDNKGLYDDLVKISSNLRETAAGIKRIKGLIKEKLPEEADKKYRPVNQANIIRNNRGR